MNIAIIAFPPRNNELANTVGINKLSSVLAEHDNVFVIQPLTLSTGFKESLFSSSLRLLIAQFTTSKALLSIKCDLVINFDPELLLVPFILSKVRGIKSYSLLRADITGIAKRKNKYAVYIRNIVLRLSDKILIYSNSLIDKWNLHRYLGKLEVFKYSWVDTDIFYDMHLERIYDVAFIGRLSHEKGIRNFLEATEGLNRLIIGDGELSHLVNNPKWASHKEVAYYLNRTKLLVVPSYSEGLPNIILEAIACNTPVLANDVGCISEMINDYIMPDNKPETIREYIDKILDLLCKSVLEYQR